MSNLSELLPAGAGAKSADFVASGTLGSGVTVVLKADGTVEAVSGAAEGVGTPVVFDTGNAQFTSATYDSNSNKVVVAYRDQSSTGYGTAVVGTVSGTSISFGSYVYFNSSDTYEVSATFDSNSNKVVIVYRDGGNSNYGRAVVGTVSGTSISFGSTVLFNSAYSQYMAATFDSNSNKVVVAYLDGGQSFYGTAKVGTVSGTSISFGSAVVYESASAPFTRMAFDSNSNKVVITYYDAGNSNRGTAVVGNVSGTSISFGTAVVFQASLVVYPSVTFDSNSNKIVIAYQNSGNSNYGTAIVGTVSGTSISFGSAVVFNSAFSSYESAVFDSNTNKVVVAYADGGTTGKVIVGTVSGTSIGFGSPTTFESTSTSQLSATYDVTNNKVVMSYADSALDGKAAVFQVEATNSADFVGITDQAIANTATGAVIVQGGVSEKVSGLTTGSDYYVQDDGSLSTTVSSVPAGRALSSTSILLEG